MKRKTLFMLVFISFFIGSYSSVKAAPVNDDNHNVSIYKSWTVEFNTPIAEKSLTEETIYIVNENGTRVNTVTFDQSNDGKSITLNNREPYLYGSTYTIHIAGQVASKNGKTLKQPVTHTFTTESKYSKEAIDYFLEIAIGSEWSEGDDPVRKWQTNPTIQVFGSPTEQDLQSLNQVIQDVNHSQDSITLQRVEQNPNVKVYYVPLADFDQYVNEPKPGNWGLFYYWYSPSYVINKSTILIATDKTNQKESSHLLREELTQALGLPRDSFSYEDSIFYQGWTSHTNYSAMDEKLIQMLYESDIHPGMSAAEAENTLQNLKD